MRPGAVCEPMEELSIKRRQTASLKSEYEMKPFGRTRGKADGSDCQRLADLFLDDISLRFRCGAKHQMKGKKPSDD